MSPCSTPARSDSDSPTSQMYREQKEYRQYGSRGTSSDRTADLDSPTRQLVDELARFYLHSERRRQKRLNEADAAEKKEHDQAIEHARIKHEEVRLAAEKACETFNLELERQRRERAEAETRALEAARRANEELEARQKAKELENARRLEEHAKKIEAQNREIAESRARAKLLEEQAVANKKRLEEEAVRDAREKQQQNEQRQLADVHQRAAQQGAAHIAPLQPTLQQTQGPSPSPPTNVGKTAVPSSSPPGSALIITHDARLEEHKKYLDLHQRLKKTRQDLNAACKKAKSSNPSSPLVHLQETRRTVTKLVGQVVANNSENNKDVRAKIMHVLLQAKQVREAALDARLFVVHHVASGTSEQDVLVSGVLIYLLNIIVKRAIVAWVLSASTTTFNAADPWGVLLAAIFGNRELQWNGSSFGDIALAKFHASCPILFGIYGPENKEGGRTRLGWRKEDGEWIPSDKHYERMAGLGAGWASLTLRKITKNSPLRNVFPAWHFWRSVSCIVNTPAEHVTSTHFVVLKALLHHQSVRTFIRFYGQAAILALRKAIIDFPATAPKNESSQAVMVLRDTLKKEIQLQL